MKENSADVLQPVTENAWLPRWWRGMYCVCAIATWHAALLASLQMPTFWPTTYDSFHSVICFTMASQSRVNSSSLRCATSNKHTLSSAVCHSCV